jgi:hypothetical protein
MLRSKEKVARKSRQYQGTRIPAAIGWVLLKALKRFFCERFGLLEFGILVTGSTYADRMNASPFST